MNILLIDNNVEEHALFELALSRLNVGAEFFASACCDDAIEKVKNNELPNPNLIFLDIGMPEVDGNACLQMMKEDGAFKGVRIIVYSTIDHVNDIHFMLAHGAETFLEKSRSFSVFSEGLKQILSKNSVTTT